MPSLSPAIRRTAFLCLPCAAVFAVGLTLSTRVSAQYPGGGGYPGSDGWFPVKPPVPPATNGTLGTDPLNTNLLFYTYDWTKLACTSSTTATSGQTSGGTSTFFPGSDGAATALVGGSSGIRARSARIFGLSTLKFQWVPPNNTAGQPDWLNFPAPPLFVLGSLWPNGNLGGTTGMAGSGSLADGWGWTSVPLVLPQTTVSELPHRKTLAATGMPATVTLSPSASISLSVTGANQSGSGGVYFSEAAYPIILAAPNPLTNPLLGDGSNQYVYNYNIPVGELDINPTSVTASGASSDDLNWLLPHVDWEVRPTISGILPYSKTVNGSQINPNTYTGYQHPVPALCFRGLPSSSSGTMDDPNSFGNHIVLLKVDGQNSQYANIQTFFTAISTNWPNSDGVTPNWFYYYNELRPFPGIYDPSLSSAGMCTTSYLFNHNTKEYVILGDILSLGPSAAQYSPVPVFEVAPNGFIWTAGTVKLKGVLSYIYVCGHELGHEAAQTHGVEVPYIDNTPPAGIVDTDGDGVPDSWEIAHHLDPNDSDTAGYYGQMSGPDAGKGDRESLATMIGLGQLQTYSSLWQRDWADIGVQYGRRSRFVPFEYDPYDISQYPSSSLPANVLTDWP